MTPGSLPPSRPEPVDVATAVALAAIRRLTPSPVRRPSVT